MKCFPLLVLLVLIGCVHHPSKNTNLAAFNAIRGKVRTATAQEPPALPQKLIGPAWDYGEMPGGLVFEVWVSTNLKDWVLVTNTVEKSVVFPAKQAEFYKVRARLGSLVSDWATTQ